ncbi:hypothetical protein BJ742DRAFT_766496 [Cladochytrium replicatum]|nr:hypothetical protein BJ742DRAFT_766496 [Cladochytrium replicatum]
MAAIRPQLQLGTTTPSSPPSTLAGSSLSPRSFLGSPNQFPPPSTDHTNASHSAQSPVGTVPSDIGIRQRLLQQQRYGYLQEALFAHFSVLPSTSSNGLANPAISYEIKFPQRPDLPVIPDFKPFGLAGTLSVAEFLVAEWKGARQATNAPLMKEEVLVKGLTSTGALGIALDAARAGLERLDYDERYTQGGILYLLGSVDLFWTTMIVWHLHGTTGHSGWDEELSRLTLFPDDPFHTPCMFFRTPYGCQDRHCRHSHLTSSALRNAALLASSSSNEERIATRRQHGVSIQSAQAEHNKARRSFYTTEQIHATKMLQPSLVLPPLRKASPFKSSSGDEATSPTTPVNTSQVSLSSFFRLNNSDVTIVSPERANSSTSLGKSDSVYSGPGTVPSRKPALLISLQNLRDNTPTPASARSPLTFLDMHNHALAAVQRQAATCANCKTVEPPGVKFKMCSRCQIERYCCKDCQENHWRNIHSRLCIAKAPLSSRRPS